MKYIHTHTDQLLQWMHKYVKKIYKKIVFDPTLLFKKKSKEKKLSKTLRESTFIINKGMSN